MLVIGWITNVVYLHALNAIFPCVMDVQHSCSKLSMHKYDLHPLTLTYTVENDSEEYYCYICEKERSPNYWFYSSCV